MAGENGDALPAILRLLGLRAEMQHGLDHALSDAKIGRGFCVRKLNPSRRLDT